MSIDLHRNWETATPEIAGKFYFSGTLNLGRAALSFEPQSIKVDIVANEGDGLRAIFAGKEFALTIFDGRWLGPEPEGVVWQ